MKLIFRLAALVLLLTVAVPGRSEENAGPPTNAKTRMHDQLASLVRGDAGAFTVPVPAEASGEGVDELPDDTLKLETMTVKGEKIIIPPPIQESQMQEFFRTGTLWEKVGPRFTRRLIMKGDEGILFRISW